MALSNREKQKRYRESRFKAGDARIACWLNQDDKQRLHRLIEMMSESEETKAGYSDVISQALKELEIRLSPPGTRNLVRYGLIFMENRRINNE